MMFLMYVILKLRTGDDDSNYKFVSWTEFVKDMLSKGEVSAPSQVLHHSSEFINVNMS